MNNGMSHFHTPKLHSHFAQRKHIQHEAHADKGQTHHDQSTTANKRNRHTIDLCHSSDEPTQLENTGAFKHTTRPEKRIKVETKSKPDSQLIAQAASPHTQHSHSSHADSTASLQPHSHSLAHNKENTPLDTYDANDILDGSWCCVGCDEIVLRKFDLDPRFGPSTGLNRWQRWQRAERFGLKPPQQVKDILHKYNLLVEDGVVKTLPKSANSQHSYSNAVSAGCSTHSLFENIVERILTAEDGTRRNT